jgi:hypothetical protein
MITRELEEKRPAGQLGLADPIIPHGTNRFGMTRADLHACFRRSL